MNINKIGIVSYRVALVTALFSLAHSIWRVAEKGIYIRGTVDSDTHIRGTVFVEK